ESPKWRRTIFKLDENGDSLWTRQLHLSDYNGKDYSLNVYDLELTSDNGFVIAGYVNFDNQIPEQQPILIKTDSLGWDGNTYIKNYELNEAKAKVYPNPTSGNFDLAFNAKNKHQDYISRIYSLSGTMLQERCIESGEVIPCDISNYQNGLYVITIEESGRVIWASKICLSR
ncbi:MAG: T9SS type A sorting domain-containing protein, partial [Patescibacteria group bacterium]